MTCTLCPGCSAEVRDDYCGHCGQRQPRPGDFSLKRLVGEAWSELSDTDSRLWRSLAGIFRPGLLTEAYLQYRWQQYLPPLRLFLIASGVYFLLAWDVSFGIGAAQVQSAPAGEVPTAMREIFQDPAAVALLSDITSLVKFMFVLPMGAFVALLHRGNRLPMGAHLVFAMHFTCFDFALFSLAAPLLAWTPAAQQPAALGLATLAGAVLLCVWATLAVRRVYRRTWGSSLYRGAMILLADFVLSTIAGQVAGVAVVFART